MSKYFLVNNKQEWDWLMQKFEAEGIKWRAGLNATAMEPLTGYEDQVIELVDCHLIHAKRKVFVEALGVTNFIEVNRLMKGEYHG
ncbi:hypothetical protein [Ligilactobacillus acidipiscis]|uniref:hypothetical protein n=1 Tax=Ligilactobacillus acidipiscis TaxID=89059 RepID=UPI0022E8640B|nr:hypothetical protein [Ligilactobacillus acidipiscis]